MTTELWGKGASGGRASGRLAFFERRPPPARKRAADPKAETERFQGALREAGRQLSALRLSCAAAIGRENAELFEIHRMMLDDPEFSDPIVERIESLGARAEWAVMEAGAALAREFSSMSDAYMRARATDALDLSGRLAGILRGRAQGLPRLAEPSILCADDFYPSEMAQIDRSEVMALASREGDAGSHSAIFARALGIPWAIGFGPALSPELSGRRAELDGDSGRLGVAPEL
ncbi:MAG: PEP-utilizing enzyme [Treponema sp.]|nr:PEP-utilizing enzyme [Treponema sp.]